MSKTNKPNTYEGRVSIPTGITLPINPPVEDGWHTIMYSGEITQENIQNLINEISEHRKVNLYFSTDGGFITAMDCLIDHLNYLHKLGRIVVYVVDYCASAGAKLLTDYEGPIIVTKGFKYFMFHLPDLIMPTFRQTPDDKRVLKMLKQGNEEFCKELASIGISKPNVAKIRRGQDVFLYRDQLSSLKNVSLLMEENKKKGRG